MLSEVNPALRMASLLLRESHTNCGTEFGEGNGCKRKRAGGKGKFSEKQSVVLKQGSFSLGVLSMCCSSGASQTQRSKR